MKEMEKKTNKQKKPEAVQHLLTMRTKKIQSLEEEVEGYAETVRLCAAFIGQLSVALMGEDSCGVRGTRNENGVFSLRISREALAEAIDRWQIRIEREATAYRVLIEPKEQK